MRYIISCAQFSCSVVSDSLRPHESQHSRPPCLSPTPGVHPDSRVHRVSHVQLCATLWTVALQDTVSRGFSRQEYLSGLPYPLPEDLLNPGIKPVSVMSPALAVRFFTTRATWEGAGCDFHLQGIFLTQGMNHISCIAGRFFHSHSGPQYSQVDIMIELIYSNLLINGLPWWLIGKELTYQFRRSSILE